MIRIRLCGWRGLSGGQRLRADATLRGKRAVEGHFLIEGRIKELGKAPHGVQVGSLCRRQGQDAAVFNQEYIVLTHIKPEFFQRQAAVSKTDHKGVRERLVPGRCGGV